MSVERNPIEDLLDDMEQLKSLGIPVPMKAFEMALTAKEEDYEPLSTASAVDLIINLCQAE